MILWDDKTKEVMVVQHPPKNKEGNHLPMSDGACWSHWRNHTTEEQIAMLYRIGMILALNFDIPTETIHEAFCNVVDYREHMSDYMPSIKIIH